MESMKFNKKDFKPEKLLVIGRSNTSKSYTTYKYILQLLKDKIISPKRLIIFSKTYKTDDSTKQVIKYCQSKYKQFLENNCFDNIREDVIEVLFNTQKQIKEMNPDKLKHYFIVFDDLIGESLLSKKNSILVSFYSLCRHYNISICLIMQKFKSYTSPILREQTTHLIITQHSCKKALLDLLQEYDESSNFNTKDSLKQMFDYYLKAIQQDQNRGNLVIYCMRSHGQNRIECCFQSGIFLDTQQNQIQE